MNDVKYIYDWMQYYSEIDFNVLSKFEITETPKETIGVDSVDSYIENY